MNLGSVEKISREHIRELKKSGDVLTATLPNYASVQSARQTVSQMKNIMQANLSLCYNQEDNSVTITRS